MGTVNVSEIFGLKQIINFDEKCSSDISDENQVNEMGEIKHRGLSK